MKSKIPDKTHKPDYVPQVFWDDAQRERGNTALYAMFERCMFPNPVNSGRQIMAFWRNVEKIYGVSCVWFVVLQAGAALLSRKKTVSKSDHVRAKQLGKAGKHGRAFIAAYREIMGAYADESLVQAVASVLGDFEKSGAFYEGGRRRSSPALRQNTTPRIRIVRHVYRSMAASLRVRGVEVGGLVAITARLAAAILNEPVDHDDVKNAIRGVSLPVIIISS